MLPARLVHGLLHGDRHLARLALAHADAAVAVAHHRERGETEYASALDDLGDAVDRDHLFLETVAALLASTALRLHSCHRLPRLELQPGFAGSFRERLHAAMVPIAGAVERHLLDAAAAAFSAMRLPTTAAAAALPPLPLAPSAAAHFGLQRRCGGQHAVAFGRDHLRVDVPVAAMHASSAASPAPQSRRGSRAPGADRDSFLSLILASAPYFFLVSFRTTTSSA